MPNEQRIDNFPYDRPLVVVLLLLLTELNKQFKGKVAVALHNICEGARAITAAIVSLPVQAENYEPCRLRVRVRAVMPRARINKWL